MTPDGPAALRRTVGAGLAPHGDARYRALFEIAPVAVATCATDGRFTMVNPAICALLGYDAEELLGMNWQDITHPDDVGTVMAAFADVVAGRIDTVRATTRYVHADGHRIWGEVSVASPSDGTGQRTELAVCIVDITEQVEARQQQQALTDAILDPQVLIEAVRDAHGRVVDFRYRQVNQAACDYLGVRREELVGRRQLETLPKLRESGLHARYLQCLQTGEPVILDDFAYFNEILSAPRRYDIRASRVSADTLSLTWRDVTDRAEQHLAVERAHELLRAASDAMFSPQAVVEVIQNSAGEVADLVYLDVNRAFCEYTGMGRDEHVGHSMLETFPGVDGAGLMSRYAHCALSGEPVALDDFPYFNELLGRTCRYDIQGRRVRPGLIVITFHDTTERFETSQRIARSEERYRLLVMNSGDAILHVRDGAVVWVSPAIVKVLGASPEYWVGKKIRDVVPPEDIPAFEARWAILQSGGEVQQRIRVRSIDGMVHWVHLRAKPFYSADGRQDGVSAALRLIDHEVAAEEQLAEAQRRQAAADELYRRSMESAAVGMCLARPEGQLIDVNPAMCEFFGYDAETLLNKTWIELTAPEYLDADLAYVADLVAGRIQSYEMDKQYLHADGHRIWGHLAVGCVRNPDGSVAMSIGQITDITEQVRSQEQLARADQLYRRSVDSAAVGMCLIDPIGGFVEVNDAVCEFFGYDADTLKRKTWQDLTAPDFLAADLSKVDDVLEGRRDSYRMLKQYVHADGHLIWGDLSVSCVRDEQGRVEQFISQIIDVTETVEANARNLLLSQRLREDLHSAAGYMESIMPAELTGAVSVSSRYIPSQELGGDCFDYAWIDGDHLMVYLIDVSGHGIEPALLSVSLQNLLRSGAFARETLLNPAAVLTELNQMFQTEHQVDHFFTIFYGVYEKSTRTMRYTTAGAPPAYAFSVSCEGGTTTTPMITDAPPVGVLPDIAFIADSLVLPPGCRVLIFSDGASELPLAGGGVIPMEEFEDLVAQVAASREWSLDDILRTLRNATPHGEFADDVSLIQLVFD